MPSPRLESTLFRVVKILTPGHQNDRNFSLPEVTQGAHNALSSIDNMSQFIFVPRNDELGIDRRNFPAYATIPAVAEKYMRV